MVQKDQPLRNRMAVQTQMNLLAAKAMGLTIPKSVLLRADRVIE